jgi:hypothetical protein
MRSRFAQVQVLAALLIVVGAGILHGQGPPSPSQRVSLAEPVRLPGDYSKISGLAEVTAAKLIVTDEREKLVHVISLHTAARKTIGRDGRGPLEFRIPRHVFATPDGGYAIADMGNRKVLLVDSTDVVHTSYSYPQPVWAARLGGVDAHGRLYFEPLADIDRQTQQPVDSVNLYRWQPASEELTPILRIDAPDVALHVVTGTNAGTRQVDRLLFPEPFGISDEWVVLSGNRILVWQESRRQLQVLDLDGRPVRRPTSALYEAVKVTSADRAAAVPPGTTIEWSIPDAKPIMADGSALGSPDGHLWLRLHGSAGSTTQAYAVFDADGRHRGTARAPSTQTLVGLGRGAAYFAEKDQDDLVTLIRYQVRYE